MKKILVGVVAVAAIVAMAAVPGPAQAEYKIGAIFATTGGASMLGLPEKNTAEMLIDELNAKGGINGEKVKLFMYDTEADPTKANNAVKKLISKDKVDVIIGPTTSGVTMAIIPAVEKAKIPLISCAASVKIVVPVKPYVFKTPQTDIMAVERIYEKLQADGVKKIAIISVQNGFGDSGKVQLQNLAGKYGLSIVADERYGGKDTDMTTQMTKIKASDAQAIICWGTNPGPAVVAKNRKQLGITTPLYNSHGVASMTFIKLAEGAAEGTFLPAGKLLVVDQLKADDPQKKLLADYKSAYEAKWGGNANTFGGHAFDAFHLAVMGIENAAKAGKVTHASIRDELEKITGFVGTGGIFNFSADDHNGLTKDGFVLVQIKDGSWSLVK